MPRSGSELLQCILHQNPRIYGSPTSPLLEYIFAARQNFDLPEVKSQDPEMMKSAFLSMCAAMPAAYYKNITDRPIVCDKNRGHAFYDSLWEQILGERPKIIVMIRDLRSIIASFERIFRNNRHSPQGPDNPQQLLNMTVEQRVDYWLNTQPVGLALLRTLDSFQRGISGNLCFIRYEDLCRDPDAIMADIYAYIEEPYFQHDFKNIKKEVQEDDSHYGIFGNHSVKPKLESAKPNNWADVLPPQIAESIKARHSWYFETFGY